MNTNCMNANDIIALIAGLFLILGMFTPYGKAKGATNGENAQIRYRVVSRSVCRYRPRGRFGQPVLHDLKGEIHMKPSYMVTKTARKSSRHHSIYGYRHSMNRHPGYVRKVSIPYAVENIRKRSFFARLLAYLRALFVPFVGDRYAA